RRRRGPASFADVPAARDKAVAFPGFLTFLDARQAVDHLDLDVRLFLSACGADPFFWRSRKIGRIRESRVSQVKGPGRAGAPCGARPGPGWTLRSGPHARSRPPGKRG